MRSAARSPASAQPMALAHRPAEISAPRPLALRSHGGSQPGWPEALSLLQQQRLQILLPLPWCLALVAFPVLFATAFMAAASCLVHSMLMNMHSSFAANGSANTCIELARPEFEPRACYFPTAGLLQRHDDRRSTDQGARLRPCLLLGRACRCCHCCMHQLSCHPTPPYSLSVPAALASPSSGASAASSKSKIQE